MKMLLPPNWDKPDGGNDKLCLRFEKKVYRIGRRALRRYDFFDGGSS